MASSWLREEAKDTPQKQSRTPTTLMTCRYWRIRLIKQRHYCIVWNEPQLALASMSMHTKLNICVTTKRATLPHKFTYLGSSVSSTEKDIDTPLTKAWTAIDRLIWKSDLTDKMKRSFFQAAVVSILLYGCTTWTLSKRLEKKLDGNYTRMLRAELNKSWRQHPTRHQLYGHLPPITKTIQVRRTRHAGHCWRSKDELIRDVLLWTPTYGRAKAGRPARTYIQQLCEDTGCNPVDLPEAMNDREKWRERVRDIRAGGTTWWWWWWWWYYPIDFLAVFKIPNNVNFKRNTISWNLELSFLKTSDHNKDK